MTDPRIDVYLPAPWRDALKAATAAAGVPSVGEYLRVMIENDPGVQTAIAGKVMPPLSKTWGGWKKRKPKGIGG